MCGEERTKNRAIWQNTPFVVSQYRNKHIQIPLLDGVNTFGVHGGGNVRLDGPGEVLSAPAQPSRHNFEAKHQFR